MLGQIDMIHALDAGKDVGVAPRADLPPGRSPSPRLSHPAVAGRSSSAMRCRRRLRASALAAVRSVEAHPSWSTADASRTRRYFRDTACSPSGFKPLPGETPIVPVILARPAKAIHMSELLLAEGVFVTGFGYPVCAQGHARVRCQLSGRAYAMTISILRSAPSRKWAQNWGFI